MEAESLHRSHGHHEVSSPFPHEATLMEIPVTGSRKILGKRRIKRSIEMDPGHGQAVSETAPSFYGQNIIRYF